MPIQGNRYEFTPANVNNAPQQHGVYELYDGRETIYIGRASGTTIRQRLQSHLTGNEGRCTQQASHYKREINSGPIARERELLEEYERTHGRLPRCNDRVG